MSALRAFVDSQMRWSRAFDTRLAPDWTTDGNRDFLDHFAPKHLERCALVYDVGGGKQPYLTGEAKARLGCRVTGVDISAGELAAAPPGRYDATLCADIMALRGPGDGDAAICQALLEHVPDVEKAFAGLASLVRPGGKVLVFVPCRNAVFARLNLLLPESVKRAILFAIFPKARRSQGFVSYYDRCTPRDFRRLAAANGLEILEERHYYVSSYFSFFFPAYVLWRAWVWVMRALFREQAAETFSMALRKVESRGP